MLLAETAAGPVAVMVVCPALAHRKFEGIL